MFLKKQLVVVKAYTPVVTYYKYCTFPISATPAVPNIDRGKGLETKFLPVSFFYLLIFLSFVFLPSDNVITVNAWSVSFSISALFLGVEKADFGIFFFFFFLVKKIAVC